MIPDLTDAKLRTVLDQASITSSFREHPHLSFAKVLYHSEPKVDDPTLGAG